MGIAKIITYYFVLYLETLTEMGPMLPPWDHWHQDWLPYHLKWNIEWKSSAGKKTMKNEDPYILIYSAFSYILTMEMKGFILFPLVIQTNLFLVLEINFVANQVV